LHGIPEDLISNIHHLENLQAVILADYFGSLEGWVGRISTRILIMLRFFEALLIQSGKIPSLHLKFDHNRLVLQPFQFIN
jgi:hypothetical protein